MTLFLILMLGVGGALAYRVWSRRQHRRALLSSGLSEEERAIVATQVPLVRKLPPEFRSSLEGKMNVFLDQVEFVGCNGLEVTEEMELSIAAQACLLVVNSDTWYDNLSTVLIYPGAFKSMHKEHDGFVVTERETVRTGESWSRGPVILSWADARKGAANERDGHNVVLHEFAHQIDDLSGRTDGVPVLDPSQSFAEWERVILEAYERHVQNVLAGRRAVFDPYGAEGHEEFFAVAVETFFEKAVAFKQSEPEVYEQFCRLFRLDPSEWHPNVA